MAKLIDLNHAAQSATHASCDVCVIGAGAAGLYLAHRLSRDGLRVIVLEAGGATCGSGASLGIESIFSASPYPGAMEGRAFGWGGSTSRWGGLLVPHSDLDLRDEATPEAMVWKHIVNVVRERSTAVSSTLGLGGKPDFLSLPATALGNAAKLLHEGGLETVAAEFLPFWRRNLTYLASTRTGGNFVVYLNAVASKWFAEPDISGLGAVSTVEANSLGGKSLRVSAKSFVLATGAIESARILLEMDRATGERMFFRTAKIGQNLSDHLSCAIAEVHAEDRNQAARLFGPIFSKGRMRSFRFIESPKEPFVPRHFAHCIFDIQNAGFRLVKDILLGLQSRSLPDLRLLNVIDGIGGLSRLVYSRFIQSRLFVPAHTPVKFQLDIEQTPNCANRVHLGETMDRSGRPLAVVHWRIDEIDYKNIQLLAQRLLSKWPAHSHGFPRLLPINTGDTQAKPYDAYHPVGTCRMGSDKEAVVDLELRVGGTQNLYVLSTGLLPSAGTANPTFSMLCLGDRLADKLASSGERFAIG
ncbi:MAG: GMC oxidoreductase [Proteobacteria bacterium]|nr:GMC oxidoreductase [Pseudomonadota bacterium]